MNNESLSQEQLDALREAVDKLNRILYPNVNAPDPGVGQVWIDPDDGEPFMIVALGLRKYAAVSLFGGISWNSQHDNLGKVIDGLVYRAETARDYFKSEKP